MPEHNDPSVVATPALTRQLRLLSDASDEMMATVFRHDKKATLDAAAVNFQLQFHADASAIYLLDEDTAVPRLQAQFRPHAQENWWVDAEAIVCTKAIASRKVLRIHDEPHELAGKRLSSGEIPQPTSLMGVPLLNRHADLLGIAVIENKRELNTSGAIARFTDEDEAISKILANKLVVALESLRTFEALRELVQDMHSTGNIAEILKRILSRSLRLLRASRGDLVLWNEQVQDLKVELQEGSSALLSSVPPPRCVIRRVWTSGEPALIPDVADKTSNPDYHPCDDRTKSEVAVRLEWGGKPLGVLNAEAFANRPAFDEQDLTLLKLLGEYASLAYQVVGRESLYRNVFEQLGTAQPTPGLLRVILEHVRDQFGFDGGIIYLADQDTEKLRCEETISGVPLAILRKKRLHEFSYDFGAKAFATWIYGRKKGEFVPDPWHDPEQRFATKGLKAFKIKGPVIGVPLQHGDQVVGVLVVWNRKGGTQPTPEHVAELLPFAQIAAATIAYSASDVRLRVMTKEIRQIFHLIQQGRSQTDVVERILKAVELAGFERVRLFTYLADGEKFVVHSARNMPPTFCRGYAIPLARNPYAHDTYHVRAFLGRAFVYQPTDLGEDPDAEALGKDKSLPWVVAPLVVNGRCVGQIVADNHITKPNPPVRNTSLEYLTLLAAVAAQAVAIEQTVQVLGARNLPVFYARMRMDEPLRTLIRKMLVYLTHGDGLGFNRAIYLDFSEDRSRLLYFTGVGCIDHESFTHIAHTLQGGELGRVLANAADFKEDKLDGALGTFALEALSEKITTWLRLGTATKLPGADTLWPELLKELDGRIHCKELLVAPVRLTIVDGSEPRVEGLFLVDRHWAGPDLSDVDRLALAAFAEQAGQILRQHHLQRRVMATSNRAVLGFFSGSIAHQVGQNLGGLGDCLSALEEAARRGQTGLVQECAANARQTAYSIVQTVQALEALLERNPKWTETPVQEILDNLWLVVRREITIRHITLTPKLEPLLLQAQVIPDLVLQALVNLVANAMEALETMGEAAPASREITIFARQEGADSLVIDVTDNGPGIPPDRLRLIMRADSAYTSHVERGLGIGLEIVRTIATRHAGKFDLMPRAGQRGMCARLSLPLRQKEAARET